VESNCNQRRKEQVRLAQQAYRQRREAAVTDLENECESLRSNAKSIGSLFQDYHLFVSRSHILSNEPEHGPYLQGISEQIGSLVASLEDGNDWAGTGKRKFDCYR